MLMRHGEATYNSSSDFERLLTNIGVSEVKNSASVSKKFGFKPEKILCSPAKRTKQTALNYCNHLNIPNTIIQYIKEFYYKDADFYFNEILAIVNSCNTLLVIGHNPPISEIANYFSSDQSILMNTGDLFVVSFDTQNWSEIFLANSHVEYKS